MSENEKQAQKFKARWWALSFGWSAQMDEADLRDEFAAAEERGRQSAETERDELRAALIASRPFVADHYKQHALGINAKYHLDLLNRIEKALAPRDSAHEVGVLTDDNATRIPAPRDFTLNAKVGRSNDGLPVVNFDRDALHGKDRK